MAKKPRENRIPIMMSDDELKAVDDWRYSNRIATRSDAIRRLCQMALVLDSQLKPLHDVMRTAQTRVAELIKTTSKLLDETDTKNLHEEAAFRSVTANLELIRLAMTLRHVTGQAYNFKSDDVDLDEAFKESSSLKEFFSGLFEENGLDSDKREWIDRMIKKFASEE